MNKLTRIPSHFSTCSWCGKRGYPSRKVGRKVRQQHPEPRHLAVYRCDGRPDLWHLGHKPPSLRRGDKSSADVTRDSNR